MTILQHKLWDSCPDCQCTVVVCEEIQADHVSHVRSSQFKPRIREHVSGGRWETRKFLCGFTCEFSPNAGSCKALLPCTQSAAAIERGKKRSVIQEQISKLQDELGKL